MKNNNLIFFMGPSGSGKTTLIEKIISEMSDISIATIKFMHHAEFTIDPSHKDTRRHRNSGSVYTVCFSPKETILLLNEEKRGTIADFNKLSNSLPPVDIVIVESLNNPPKGSNVILVIKDELDFDMYKDNLNLQNVKAIICKTNIKSDLGDLYQPILYMNDFEDFGKLKEIILNVWNLS